VVIFVLITTTRCWGDDVCESKRLSMEDLRKVVAQLRVIPLSGRGFPWESFCLIHQSGASPRSDEMGICIERVPARPVTLLQLQFFGRFAHQD